MELQWVQNNNYKHFSITAGFDFEGSHFTATFTANSTVATVDIPIIADFISEEGTESFTVQLSLPSHEILSNLPYITHASFGTIPQATIYILEEIVLNFLKGSVEVEEGGNLILNIVASTGSDEDFNFTVKITGHDQDSQCELLTAVFLENCLSMLVTKV